MNDNDTMPFDFPTDSPKLIKVIGVGGGGGNAVKNMYKEGIQDVSFVLCNTDRQALVDSEIPIKVQLGREITKGLGAGNDPDVARQAAEESLEDIQKLFQDETQMAFITAGMGGGTGTGAAPIVARVAKDMGMLTIGIITIPFKFEKRRKIIQALKGVDEMSKHVDALLVINNERLLEIYPDRPMSEGFRLADKTLTVATKSIAEIITTRGNINLDFRDVSKILKNGGVAIMSFGFGKGDKRVEKAFEDALHSPLLNDNDIYKSKKILFNIYEGTKKPLMVEEMAEVDRFMDKFESSDIEVIWGMAEDESLDEEVKITVLATGFGLSNIPGMEEAGYATTLQPEAVETPEERAERHRQESKSEEMIIKYYGGPNLTSKRIIRTFLLSGDDFNNDNLIDALENSPTYQRTNTELAELENYRQSV